MELQDDPYVMLKEGPLKKGESKYEGFTIDILDELARRLQFNYTIIEPTGYGNCDTKENGKVVCTGMVKDLVENVGHVNV